MESKAKLLGHSVHQMLIVFPLGLLATAIVFDLVFLADGRLVFTTVAHWMIVAGLIGGLVAAPFGLIDWLAIPRGTRAKRIGVAHGLGNVVVLVLFALSLWVRMRRPGAPQELAYVLSFGGALLALVTAWLGGEFVARLGIGVDDHAHADAPSSLSRSGHGAL